MSEAWNIRFGTAGTSDSFAAQGYKSSLDVPEYTAQMGLNAFEYQCGRGVRLGLDKAARMAALAAQRDILFSVHAPYYISMSSLEEDKRLNSIQYLLQSAAVCRALGGRRIIFHSGSCGKQSREAALEKALDTMRRAVAALDEAGFGDLTLCPETMGKINQLGDLDEVLELVGHPVGGVCPFGCKKGIPVYLDVSLQRFETVFPAVGSPSSAIELNLDELYKYSNALEWIDVCKLPAPAEA